jgi:hypothetical protein
LGAVAKVITADAGSASTTTFTLGTNGSYNELLSAIDMRTAQEDDESASLVAKLTSSTTLGTTVTVTGSGKTIANIQNTAAVDIYYGYVRATY